MSSVGVVVFRNKALQESAVNNAINISNNCVDKKVHKREIVIVRKKQRSVQPHETVSVASLVRAAANTTRAPKRSRVREEPEQQEKTPAPLAVARRNARERNRVRQVNNGFAELRRHIPDEVAEAFENVTSNRGPNKKMSKVETLRMAVEYIRSLESVLNIGNGDKENATHSYPSPASSSPGDNSFEQSYFSMNSPMLDDEETMEDDELESSLPSIAPHPYARLANTDHFQIRTPLMYEDDETVQPLTPSSDLVAETHFSMETNYQFVNSDEQFCVISTDQAYCSESEVLPDSCNDLEIKYSDTIHLPNINSSAIILDNVNSINERILLEQAEYNFASMQKIDDDALLGDSLPYNDTSEIKSEIPQLDVTPEDRQQFEETLKWWQEKTKVNDKIVKQVN